MSESDQRRKVVKYLKPLHAVPVENPIIPGTPDVNYIGGWIELKWLRRWPKLISSTVKIDHFTPQQRHWLRKRWEMGGSAWLLLQVRLEWLLFSGVDAANYVGLVPRPDLYEFARVRWTRGLDRKELIQCLTMNWENWSGSTIVRPSSSTVVEEAFPK